MDRGQPWSADAIRCQKDTVIVMAHPSMHVASVVAMVKAARGALIQVPAILMWKLWWTMAFAFILPQVWLIVLQDCSVRGRHGVGCLTQSCIAFDNCASG